MTDATAPSSAAPTGRPPLACTRVVAEGREPRRAALFLHGILGRGSNWLSFARAFVRACPEWAALLPDLRLHGDSQQLPPPHDFAAAVADVAMLLRESVLEVGAIIGHSFGGKIALALAREAAAELERVFVLDASPSARPERAANDATARVLAALGALPARLTSRNQFTAELERLGVDRALGLWLAKNLVREADGLRFGLELASVAELLRDHDRADLWPAVEAAAADGPRLCFVLGGRSQSVAAADRTRLDALAARGAIELEVLPEAGHWLHTDDPAGLLELIASKLEGSSAR